MNEQALKQWFLDDVVLKGSDKKQKEVRTKS